MSSRVLGRSLAVVAASGGKDPGSGVVVTSYPPTWSPIVGLVGAAPPGFSPLYFDASQYDMADMTDQAGGNLGTVLGSQTLGRAGSTIVIPLGYQIQGVIDNTAGPGTNFEFIVLFRDITVQPTVDFAQVNTVWNATQWAVGGHVFPTPWTPPTVVPVDGNYNSADGTFASQPIVCELTKGTSGSASPYYGQDSYSNDVARGDEIGLDYALLVSGSVTAWTGTGHFRFSGYYSILDF